MAGRIDRIELRGVVPRVFEDDRSQIEGSEIWGKEIDFERGRAYLVRSDSGRGKSSLCSFVYGTRTDYSGRIEYSGEGYTGRESAEEVRRRHIGMMFQELRLFGDLTVVENIEVKNQLTKMRSRREIEEMLERVGIAEKRDTECRKLSVGQQQRVAFVRLLCQPADFLLLDEPVSHIDDGRGRDMAAMIEERRRRDGVGVVVTSIGRDMPIEYDREIQL